MHLNDNFHHDHILQVIHKQDQISIELLNLAEFFMRIILGE